MDPICSGRSDEADLRWLDGGWDTLVPDFILLPNIGPGQECPTHRRATASPPHHFGGYIGRYRAFTFAELLAAMIFVAVVIPVAVRAVAAANRAGMLAERKRIAAELAGNLLTEKIVTEEWRSSQRSGDFGDSYPGFRWAMDDETWSEDAMRVVSIEVFFTLQGREYSVRLSTLAEESEETTTGST